MTAPTIQDAKDLAYRLRAQGVIVLAFSPDDTVGGASYGMTRVLCDGYGACLDDIVDGIVAGRIRTKGKPNRKGCGEASP